MIKTFCIWSLLNQTLKIANENNVQHLQSSRYIFKSPKKKVSMGASCKTISKMHSIRGMVQLNQIGYLEKFLRKLHLDNTLHPEANAKKYYVLNTWVGFFLTIGGIN